MKRPSAQFVRFLINGVLATAVHYLALRLGIEVLKLGSAGLANLLAAPLGIATEATGGSPGPDVGPIVAKGAPWAQLAQDGTDYFDYHHTANDTLDKIDPAQLSQNVAAWAGLLWLIADSDVDFRAMRPAAPATPAR